MPSNHLILCSPPPFSLCLQSFPASKSFSSESALCIRWPKYQSFSPSNEYSGLISFKKSTMEELVLKNKERLLLQKETGCLDPDADAWS